MTLEYVRAQLSAPTQRYASARRRAFLVFIGLHRYPPQRAIQIFFTLVEVGCFCRSAGASEGIAVKFFY